MVLRKLKFFLRKLRSQQLYTSLGEKGKGNLEKPATSCLFSAKDDLLPRDPRFGQLVEKTALLLWEIQ